MEKSADVKAVRAGIGYTIGNILSKGLSFLAMPLFGRIMSVEDYGRYNTYSAFTAVLFVVVGLAVHVSIKNGNIDHHDKLKEYISSISLIVVFTSLIFLGLSVLTFIPIGNLGILEPGWLLIIAILESFCMAMITFYNHVLSVDYRHKEYVVTSLIYAVLGILLSVILIETVFSDSRYLGRVFGMLIAGSTFAVYVLFGIYKKSRPKINKTYWRYALKISIPIVPHGISQMVLSMSDRLMITGYCGDREAGIYGFANNLGTIFQVVVTAMDTAWSQWFFDRMEAGEKRKIRKAGSIYAVTVSAGAIALMAVSPELVVLMGGEKYREAVILTFPIVIAMFFSFMSFFPSAVEFYHKKTKMIAVGTVIAALLNLLLNFIFIPKYGYEAAAYTTLACYLLYYVIHSVFAYIIRKEHLFSMLIHIACCIAVSSLGILFVATDATWTVRVVTLGILILASALLFALRRDEIMKLIKTFVGPGEKTEDEFDSFETIETEKTTEVNIQKTLKNKNTQIRRGTMHNENRYSIMTLKDMFWKILFGWKIVLVFIVIGAVAGVYLGNRSYNNSKAKYDEYVSTIGFDPAEEERIKSASVEEQKTYADNRAETWKGMLFEAQLSAINDCASIKELIADTDNYIKNSIYMQIDSYNLDYVNKIYQVSSDIEGLAGQLLPVYVQNTQDGSLVEELASRMNWKDQNLVYSDITYIYALNGVQFQVTVYARSNEEAQNISSTLDAIITELCNLYNPIYGSHRIDVIDTVIGQKADLNMGNTQNGVQARQASYVSQLNSLVYSFMGTPAQYNYYNYLEASGNTGNGFVEAYLDPNKEKIGAPANSKIRNIILGVLGGMVLGALIILGMLLANGKLIKTEEMAGIFGLAYAGCLVREDKLFPVDKLLKKLYLRNDGPYSIETRAALAASKIAAMCRAENTEKIAIIGTHMRKAESRSIETLVKILKKSGIGVDTVGNMMENIQVSDEVMKCKNVLIAESVNRSSYKDIEKELAVLKGCDVNILGSICIA
ncbi:MAG: oligosaccharide flippase family protein [Lachnospiraceae bacterium]|nr:oligosaccharide flippase family protein [Lachnospiraceae bacterium]